MIMPTFNSQFEKFDIEEFEKNSDNRTSIVEDEKFYIENLLQSKGYAKLIYMKDSYVYTQKLYYQSGNIKLKGLTLVNGSEIETWYHYNEEGELIKEEMQDEGYDFSWKSVIAYCEKNEIELTKGYVKGGFQTTIYKQDLEGKKTWQITHRIDTDKIEEIYLDAKTGDLIKKETLNYRNS